MKAMLRKYCILILLLLPPLLLSATEKPTSIVREFFSNLNTYIIENDHEYHKKLLNMCIDGFVVSDVCALENSNFQSISVTLDVYLQMMKNKKAKVVVNSAIIRNIQNHRTINHSGLTVVEVDLTITSPNPRHFGYNHIYDYVYIDNMGKIYAIGDRDADNRTVNPYIFKGIYFKYDDLNGNRHTNSDSSAEIGQISYLQCYFTMFSNVSRKDTIYHKIYTPNGKLWTCSNCENVPNGYTLYSYPYEIPADKDYTYEHGFGCEDGTCWSVGKYVWEIWNRGAMLGYKTFEIRSPMKIKEVKFSAKTSSKVLNGYGKQLYNGDIRSAYLYTKITLEDKLSSEQTMSLVVTPKNNNNDKIHEKNIVFSANTSTEEVKLGDKYMSAGDYVCRLYSASGTQLYETEFSIMDGKSILLGANELTFKKNSFKPKKIKILSSTNLDNIKFKYDSYTFKCRTEKEANSIVFEPRILNTFEMEDSAFICDNQNGSVAKVIVHIPKSNEWWDQCSEYYVWGPDKYRCEFISAKMFAGQNWGAELSVFDFRFTLFAFSVANFGLRSTYDLNYDIYYAPTLSFLLPVYYGNLGHALYLSAAPTIELYKTRNSHFKKYWFSAEFGYKMSIEELLGFDFFVRYDQFFSAGIAFHFGDGLKYGKWILP